MGGHDIGSKTVNSESDCGILCLQNPKCNFWTWVKPSYDGRLGHGIRLICHLKSSDAGRVELADVVSGTKGCITGRKVVPAPAPAPASDCGCGTVTAAQDGCQCGNARCKTGQRCVEGQCKTITSCQELKRIPMAHGKVAECMNECKKTYCSGGCQSYRLHWGWSDEDKNGCVLSSCPHKG